VRIVEARRIKMRDHVRTWWRSEDRSRSAIEHSLCAAEATRSENNRSKKAEPPSHVLGVFRQPHVESSSFEHVGRKGTHLPVPAVVEAVARDTLEEKRTQGAARGIGSGLRATPSAYLATDDLSYLEIAGEETLRPADRASHSEMLELGRDVEGPHLSVGSEAEPVYLVWPSPLLAGKEQVGEFRVGIELVLQGRQIGLSPQDTLRVLDTDYQVTEESMIGRDFTTEREVPFVTLKLAKALCQITHRRDKELGLSSESDRERSPSTEAPESAPAVPEGKSGFLHREPLRTRAVQKGRRRLAVWQRTEILRDDQPTQVKLPYPLSNSVRGLHVCSDRRQAQIDIEPMQSLAQLQTDCATAGRRDRAARLPLWNREEIESGGLIDQPLETRIVGDRHGLTQRRASSGRKVERS